MDTLIETLTTKKHNALPAGLAGKAGAALLLRYKHPKKALWYINQAINEVNSDDFSFISGILGVQLAASKLQHPKTNEMNRAIVAQISKQVYHPHVSQRVYNLQNALYMAFGSNNPLNADILMRYLIHAETIIQATLDILNKDTVLRLQDEFITALVCLKTILSKQCHHQKAVQIAIHVARTCLTILPNRQENRLLLFCFFKGLTEHSPYIAQANDLYKKNTDVSNVEKWLETYTDNYLYRRVCTILAGEEVLSSLPLHNGATLTEQILYNLLTT